MMKKLLKIALGLFVILCALSMCVDDSSDQSQADHQESAKSQNNETQAKAEKQDNKDNASNKQQADQTQDLETKQGEVDKEEDKAIDYSHIIVPFSKEYSPKLYQAWGKKWIDDINTMMPKAVQHVAKNQKCDEPDDIGLSMERSTPKKEVIFFVDCKNQERFYISQSELEQGADLTAESEKLAKPSEYIRPCKQAIKEHLNHPSTFDDKVLSTHAYKGLSGNVVIDLPFTAKNSFGVEGDYKGCCIIDTQGKLSVTIE